MSRRDIQNKDSGSGKTPGAVQGSTTGPASPPLAQGGPQARGSAGEAIERFTVTTSPNFLVLTVVSLTVGAAVTYAANRLISWWAARPATQPVRYGEPIGVPFGGIVGPNGLPAPPGPIPPPEGLAAAEFIELPGEPNNFALLQDAREDPNPGVNRRRRIRLVNGEVRLEDLPFDHNTDNGANRVYVAETAWYAVPKLEFMGLLASAQASLGSLAPVTYGPYLHVHHDYAYVCLPRDTVARLKQWWQAIPVVEDNMRLCFVKCQEVTRTLALNAEAIQQVCLYATVVSTLYARESYGLRSITNAYRSMEGGYLSGRPLAQTIYALQVSCRVSGIRLLVSGTLGFASAVFVFGGVVVFRSVRGGVIKRGAYTAILSAERGAWKAVKWLSF